MNHRAYRVTIGRVVVTGAAAGRLSRNDLRELVEAAVVGEIASARLPAGRTARASVRIESGAPASDSRAVADAVARGIAHAVGVGSRRG